VSSQLAKVKDDGLGSKGWLLIGSAKRGESDIEKDRLVLSIYCSTTTLSSSSFACQHLAAVVSG
jgi:hypothetical protein